MVGTEPGPWGSTDGGGVRFRRLKRLVAGFALLSLGLVAAGATTGFLLYQRTEANLTRVEVSTLATPTEASEARHFLLVGSDDRSGLSREELRELTLGREEQFGGQRSDTVIYVYVSSDRSQVTLMSLPRDLAVDVAGGSFGKLTDQFVGGPEAVIRSLDETYGLPVNHYIEVTLGGFLDVVETLGTVTIELDEPLTDRKSGADFEAGVQEMGPVEALAFVRSRAGVQGDYERIERQQTFIRAVLSELTSGSLLRSPTALFGVVDDLSRSVTTDEGLGLEQMRYLAEDLLDVVRDGVPMSAFPSYAVELDRGFYVMPYEPGARAIADAIAAGDPLPERATRQEAGEVTVGLWSGGRAASGTVVQPTLVYAGYVVESGGSVPEGLDAGSTTVVYAVDDARTEADQVAAALGADVLDLPDDVTPPDGIDVLVSVGDDADPNRAVPATG